ncbi:hypothetical protein NEOLI_004160 [Neolecta irregularis DAH-3]|uniref:Uncharacterized protein n=1 Tax=Neolecta irregularis (strain DAH-3) TaxID=1198029 RepID=A0A1U7LNY5_NEOID|nr:hypothetical protein NEOLI_004160 [Neolecta irregularis DAH-3]|eukprot:OLL24376.1 hypothetical protein NEOLI_004160 [Neolecta irregularis DAH-3]
MSEIRRLALVLFAVNKDYIQSLRKAYNPSFWRDKFTALDKTVSALETRVKELENAIVKVPEMNPNEDLTPPSSVSTVSPSEPPVIAISHEEYQRLVPSVGALRLASSVSQVVTVIRHITRDTSTQISLYLDANSSDSLLSNLFDKVTRDLFSSLDFHFIKDEEEKHVLSALFEFYTHMIQLLSNQFNIEELNHLQIHLATHFSLSISSSLLSKSTPSIYSRRIVSLQIPISEHKSDSYICVLFKFSCLTANLVNLWIRNYE